MNSSYSETVVIGGKKEPSMANDYSGIPILKTKKGFIWLELEIILADYMKQGISCPVTGLNYHTYICPNLPI